MDTIIIDISKEAEKLKMCVYEKEKTTDHKHYSEKLISNKYINELCVEVTGVFNKAATQNEISGDYTEELCKITQLLYDNLLSNVVKEYLKNTKAKYLIYSIDEQLVQIPWELLHDGINFICLRFAIGRIVRTKQRFHDSSDRVLTYPLKMLALCDPAGNLKSAYEEAGVIRDEVDKEKDKIRLHLKTTEIDRRYVKNNIKDYDIVHFAGHAEYNPSNPLQSGWVLSDGSFTAEDVMSLGSSASVPSLVFSNACQSGTTDEWKIEPGFEDKIYGLANAFLLTGIKHYIGTFWKILDKPCPIFTKTFYKSLISGVAVGEALKLSRLKTADHCGDNFLVWSSYVLYGDPTSVLFDVSAKKPAAAKPRSKKLKALIISLLLAGLISGGLLGAGYLRKARSISLSVYKIDDLDTKEQDDEVTREIISNLKNINLGNLRVIDLSVLLPSGIVTEKSLSTICKKFNINLVVVGEYKMDGDEIKGRIRLMNPLTGDVLQSHDVVSADIMGFSEQATLAIMDMAKVKISEVNKQILTKRPTNNLQAYLLFSKTWRLFLDGDNHKVLELCNQVLELDPDYVDVYKRLADTYDRLGQRDLALEYCFKYRDVSEKKRDWQNLANAYLKIGWLRKSKDYFTEALEYFQKALDMAKLRGLPVEEAKAYSRIGSWYEEKADYDLALRYFMQAKAINERYANNYNNKYELAGNYREIGLIYLDKDSYKKSLGFTKKSLEIYKDISDLNGMATCYTNIGEAYRYQGLLDEALKYYKLGLELDITLEAHYETSVDYNVLGEIYFEKQDYNKAIYYYNKALEMRRAICGGIDLSETLANLGVVYHAMKQYDKAVEYLNEAIEIGDRVGKKRCMFDYDEIKTLLGNAVLELNDQ